MLLDLILNGLVQGSLLALITVGYSLAYGSAKVINFAHADVMIAGGGYLVLLWIGATSASWGAALMMAILFGMGTCISILMWLPGRKGFYWKHYGAAACTGMVVAGLTYYLTGQLSLFAAACLAVPWTAALALAVYRVAYLPLLRREAPRTSVLLAALGMSIAIESYLLIAWGSERRVFPSEKLPTALNVRAVPNGVGIWDSTFHYGIVPLSSAHSLPTHDLAIILVFILVTVALGVFFRFSRTADAIIASADAPTAARACGIPVERILGHAFLLGGAIASLGGTLYVLRAKSLDPTSGFSPGILAFAACVLGGIGSLRGSIAGAFITSIVISLAPAIPLQEWAGVYLPTSWLRWLPSLNLSDWSFGVIYVLMISIILFKPRGLFER
jgi:branched-subunit amino acid ABC-type transport system permease component